MAMPVPTPITVTSTAGIRPRTPLIFGTGALKCKLESTELISIGRKLISLPYVIIMALTVRVLV